MGITPEELSTLRKLTSEVKKINENNIVLDLNGGKLYSGDMEFNIHSSSMQSDLANSKFTEIKVLVDFDKPTGEQL